VTIYNVYHGERGHISDPSPSPTLLSELLSVLRKKNDALTIVDPVMVSNPAEPHKHLTACNIIYEFES